MNKKENYSGKVNREMLRKKAEQLKTKNCPFNKRKHSIEKERARTDQEAR